MSAVLALSILALTALSGAAKASTELVQNGDFEETLLPKSSQFGSLYPSQQVTDWTSSGYNFVFLPGTADNGGASGTSGNLQLWGPDNGSDNGMPLASPAGGNFIAADGAYETAPISQTINGLTPGQEVALAFYWAGAQQHGFTSPTTEKWQVSLGSEVQDTPTIHNPNHGFTGWFKETFVFTPTSSSEVLSFLAIGTPTGVPPFSLLDGVSMTAVTVPEPASWSILAAGLLGLGGVAIRRRKAAGNPAGADN